MLRLESSWNEVIEDCRSQLSEIGIPVEAYEQFGQNDNQFQFTIRLVQNDLLAQCDLFHLAKHAIKYLAFTHDYHVSFLPLNSSGELNHLDLTLKGLNNKNASSLLHWAPNINSFRRIKKLAGKEKKKWSLLDSSNEGQLRVRPAPDLNLYLAIASLLGTQQLEKQIEENLSYSGSLESFNIRDDDNKTLDTYYRDIYAHEHKEFEENFTEWETNRIY